MKKIEAIIKPFRLDEVTESLEELGVSGITVTEIRRFTRQKLSSSTSDATNPAINLLPKIKLEVVVNDEQLEQTIAAIIKSAQTGLEGDGKIFIYDLEDAIRISNGERGPQAIAGK